MLFASAGYRVTLHDLLPEQIQNALDDIEAKLLALEEKGLLRGNITAREQRRLVEGCEDFEKAIEGAAFVMECIPERVELKEALFTKLDSVVDDKTIMASSTSCIAASRFTENMKHRQNCLVAHPVNPVYFLRLVELVPAPWTDQSAVRKTRDLMNEIGQAPVVLNREVDGFAVNRVQYAVINESWNLVKDGVMSREDVDTVMTQGLGPRYAFLGPLMVMHLNGNGIEDYCEKYGAGTKRVSNTFSEPPDLSVQSAKQTGISGSLFSEVPPDEIANKLAWRDSCMAQISQLKHKIGDK